MQTVQVLADRCTSRIHIGKQGENEATRVEFDVKTWLEMWPGANVALAVVSPHGDAYPATVTTEDGITTWVVTSADTAYAGIGKCEIRILLGDVIKKSVTWQTFIAESFTATGTAPDPVEDWIEDAQETLGDVESALTDIPETINTALAEAKESGEFDGPPGVGVPEGGATGQVLKKKSGTDYDTEWADESGGGGGTSDYDQLNNRPQINSTTLTGNKSLSDLGIASASDLSGKQTKITASGILKGDGNGGVTAATAGTDYGTYSKPSGGIPSSDMATAVQTSLGKADTAYQKPSGGIPSTDMASAVQTSLGKADTAYQKPGTGIPASDLASGVIPTVPSASSATPQPLGTAAAGSSGDYARADHVHAKPTAADVGAAPASTVIDTVSGSTPSITGVADHRYVCGEVSTLSIQAPASGCIDVVFESGSTATVLTVTSAKSGVTAITWADGFSESSVEANVCYLLTIMDGEYGIATKFGGSSSGGGGEGAWYKLVDATASQETSTWVISSGDNGEDFDDYKKLLVMLLVAPNSNSKTSRINLGLSNTGSGLDTAYYKPTVYDFALGVASNNSIFSYAIFEKGGFGIIQTECLRSFNSGSLINNLPSGKPALIANGLTNNSDNSTVDLDDVFRKNFTSVMFQGYENVIGSGSKCQVWGYK